MRRSAGQWQSTCRPHTYALKIPYGSSASRSSPRSRPRAGISLLGLVPQQLAHPRTPAAMRRVLDHRPQLGVGDAPRHPGVDEELLQLRGRERPGLVADRSRHRRDGDPVDPAALGDEQRRTVDDDSRPRCRVTARDDNVDRAAGRRAERTERRGRLQADGAVAPDGHRGGSCPAAKRRRRRADEQDPAMHPLHLPRLHAPPDHISRHPGPAELIPADHVVLLGRDPPDLPLDVTHYLTPRPIRPLPDSKSVRVTPFLTGRAHTPLPVTLSVVPQAITPPVSTANPPAPLPKPAF